MPLLALPRELLLDIIGHVAAGAPSALGGLKSLAHSCAVLRALAITRIYAAVAIPRDAGHLGALLADYPHLAACVRRLDLEAPSLWPSAGLLLLRRLLRHCTLLHDLALSKHSGGLRTGFENATLTHLPPSSRHSLHTLALHNLPLHTLLASFHHLAALTALHTLRMHSSDVYNPYDLQRHRTTQTTLLTTLLQHPPTPLPSIRTFHFDAPFPYRLPSEPLVGSHLASSLPNLSSLSLSTSADVIYGALSTYALGSHLTELTLTASYPSSAPTPRTNPQRDTPQRNHFCDVLLRLSSGLRSLVLCGTSEMRVCQTLVSAVWPALEVLRVRCLLGCEGVRPEVLREGLVRVVEARRGAVVVVEGRFGEGLVVCGGGEEYVAGVEAFGRLDPGADEVEEEGEVGWSLGGEEEGEFEEDRAPWAYD